MVIAEVYAPTFIWSAARFTGASVFPVRRVEDEKALSPAF